MFNRFYGTDFIFVILAVSLAAILLFFLLREVICWYYKINALLSKLDRQNQLMEEQNNLIRMQMNQTNNQNK